MDIVSLITLQGRSRRNALSAKRRLGRHRRDAEEAQRAVTAAALSPDAIDPVGDSPI